MDDGSDVPARDHVVATVLGPVTLDGENLTKRQQSIVAALVLFGVDGASTGELIDAVWPHEVPRAARASLHNQITRLRRRFGVEVIDTTADVYRIGRPTDVAEFERLTRLGMRSAPGSGAVEALSSGLTWWRGTPYRALSDHARSDAERARLTALHADAVERLAEDRISAGDVGRAIHDLNVAVEENPFREHRWELLMTALHRTGRRAEALAAYQRLEQLLQLELNTEPAATLVDLRDRIANEESPAPRVVDLTDDQVRVPERAGHRARRHAGPVCVRAAIRPTDRRRSDTHIPWLPTPPNAPRGSNGTSQAS